MNEALLQQSATGLWLRFCAPCAVIKAQHHRDVLPALQEIEHLVEKNNWYAVGLVSYEAAPGFDRALRVRTIDADSSLPLLYFALYEKPEIIPPSQIFYSALKNHEPEIADAREEWQPSVDRATYNRAIDIIRQHIARGDTYQVNYTWQLRRQFSGDPQIWFKKMVAAQCPRHAAYLDMGQFVVLSVSPELFFSLDDQRIITRPMKGTAARAPIPARDWAQASALRASAKDRAENVMIVDMMRNDLSRIATLGSVQVAQLFDIEPYPTVWQMTTTVTATTTYSISEIFRALFPAASVTGAPKVNTMEIISRLEKNSRGIYTGAIGFIAPGRQAEFNVAIRTVVLERATGIAQYGVGGGIIWDSEAEAEYAECLAKARVLWVSRPRFSLLETLLWTPDIGFFLLSEHLERIVESARYFAYPTNPARLQQALAEITAQFSQSAQRVRLFLDEDGTIRTEFAPLDASIPEVLLALAPTAINSLDPFFYHKTTHRVEYEQARRACPWGTDVLLWNEQEEITETTIANIVVEIDGKRVTPPIAAGLLAGTYRRRLLEEGIIHERTIKRADLARASALWVINSVRGWQRAKLINSSCHRQGG